MVAQTGGGNTLSRALEGTSALIGAGCMLPSPFAAEIVAWGGFDYVTVDQQHGVMDNTVLVSMFQAIEARGSIPITRVPTNQPDLVTRALDFGAAGVIVPLVETRDQATLAVSACRYPPVGIRSYGPVRAQVVADSPEVDVLQDVACIALVETRLGVENVDAIASVPGLAGIYVGPNDLALSLGLPRTTPWPPSGILLGALEEIVAACRRHGIVPGLGVGDAAAAEACVELGFRMVGVGYDVNHLATAMRTQYRALRRAIAPQAGTGLSKEEWNQR